MAYQKRKVDAAPPNEWLNTYSDVVTLLLTFFVLLFAISSVNQSKYEALVQSFNPNALKVSGSTGVTSEGEVSTEDPDFDEIYNKINNYIKENNLTESIGISKTDDYIMIRFMDNVLFNPDKAVLTDSGKVVLAFLSDAILTTEEKIELINIEGHTADSIDGDYSSFSWQLSVSRAVNVLRFMVEQKGVSPSKLIAAGYSKYKPIADNHSAWGRAQNRRVEITITKAKEEADTVEDVVEALDSAMTQSENASSNATSSN